VRSKRKLGNPQTGPHPMDFVDRSVASFYAQNPHYDNETFDAFACPELRSINFAEFLKIYGDCTLEEVNEAVWYCGYDTYGPDVSVASYVAQAKIYRSQHSDHCFVEGGLQSVVDTTIKRSGVEVKTSHCLTAMYRDAIARRNVLEFNGGEVVCHAKQVICAMPREGLVGIKDPTKDPTVNQGSFWPEERRRAIEESVVPISLFKAFLTWDRPWWPEIGYFCGKSTTDLPVRQVHYYDQNTLMIYNSGPNADKFGQRMQTDAKQMLTEMIVNVRDMHASDMHIQHTRNYDYKYWKAGTHKWRVGVNVPETIQIIQDGSLDGSNVFVCGDCFSRHQGWVEGALESANAVLAKVDFPMAAVVEECDVAIVGAGMAGAYMAKRLEQTLPFLKIIVFDSNDRVGGRAAPNARFSADPIAAAKTRGDTETSGSNIEGERDDPKGMFRFGPMNTSEFEEFGSCRYFQKWHPRVRKLVRGYALQDVPADMREKGDANHDRFYYRGEMAEREVAYMPIDPMRFYEKQTVAQFQQDLVRKVKERYPEVAKPDFDPFQHQVFRNMDELGLFHHFGFNEEEVDKFKAYSGFDVHPSGTQVSSYVKQMELYASGHEEQAYITHGYQRIIRNMLKDSNATVRLHHHCTKLEFGGEKKVLVHFDNNHRTVVADRVVVTGTKDQVEQIISTSSVGSQAPRLEAMSKVVPVPLFKAALEWKKPWWMKLGHFGGHGTTDLRIRHLVYYNFTTLLVYATGENARWWNDQFNTNPDGAKAELTRQVRVMHELETLASPNNLTTNYYPCGTHRWMTGVDVDKELATIEGNNEGTKAARVLVCGEAFSKTQGWVEGALESVESVVNRYFSDSDLELQLLED